jgi:serine/threonine protein kinase
MPQLSCAVRISFTSVITVWTRARPYIAMDLLEGESLGARLAKRRLTFAEVVEIVTQVGRALGLAHGKEIVHRDLKPDNIFLTREGELEVTKVLDFGVAKRLDVSSFGDPAKTRTGTILGTPYYMSPEQAHGKTVVDQRADIWSLGVIVYECVTGRRPFEEETLAALLLAICAENSPVPSQVAVVPPGFDEWFARATSRDLSARFQTASEAASALVALAPGGTIPRLSSSPPVVTSTASPATLVVPAGTVPEVAALDQTAVPSSVSSHGIPKQRATGLLVGVGLAVASLLGISGYFLFRTSSAPTSTAAEPTSGSAFVSSVAAAVEVAPDTSVGAAAPVPSVTRNSFAAQLATVASSAVVPSRSGKRPPVSITDDKTKPARGVTAPPTLPNISGF